MVFRMKSRLTLLSGSRDWGQAIGMVSTTRIPLGADVGQHQVSRGWARLWPCEGWQGAVCTISEKDEHCSTRHYLYFIHTYDRTDMYHHIIHSNSDDPRSDMSRAGRSRLTGHKSILNRVTVDYLDYQKDVQACRPHHRSKQRVSTTCASSSFLVSSSGSG